MMRVKTKNYGEDCEMPPAGCRSKMDQSHPIIGGKGMSRQPMIRTLLLAVCFLAVIPLYADTYIVVMRPTAQGTPAIETLLHDYHAAEITRWKGRIVVQMTQQDAAALRASEFVRYVQPLSDRTGSGSGGLSAASLSRPFTKEVNAVLPTWSTGNYTYDGAGNIASIGADSAAKTRAYQYDVLSRLTRAQTSGATATTYFTYRYDGFGNRVERNDDANYLVNSSASVTNNQLTAASYKAGNVTQLSGTGYKYDASNMVVERHKGSLLLDVAIYTAADERLALCDGDKCDWTVRGPDQKVRREFESDSVLRVAAPTHYLWVEDYAYRNGVLLGAQRESSEGDRVNFHLDHLGTPRLTTGGGGQLLTSAEYEPFGKEITDYYIAEIQDAGFERPEPLRFTGHQRDFLGGTGTNNDNTEDYMHARYYRAVEGRFLTVDPELNVKRAMAKPQGWNRYTYVDNSPINATDPNGREIYYQVHEVAGGYSHTSIRIEPADQHRYANDADFQKYKNQQTGRSFMTLGAGSESRLLVSNVNRSRDVDLSTKTTSVKVDLKGRDENKVIGELRAADSKYKDNLLYRPFPGPATTMQAFGQTITIDPATYNSNSYTSGLLKAVGLTPPKVKEDIPGYDRPIPKKEFQ